MIAVGSFLFRGEGKKASWPRGKRVEEVGGLVEEEEEEEKEAELRRLLWSLFSFKFGSTFLFK